MFITMGRGTPLVFIPGLQGRWEYVRPAVEALAADFRVITFSLCDERPTGAAVPNDAGFDPYGDQVAAALDAHHLPRAVICGLSFGGRVALNFAARFPERTAALVLASTPGPGWRLRRRHEIYARLPWLFGPVFMIEAPFRARREIRAALPAPSARRAFARWIARAAVAAPVSVSRMAARARLIAACDSAPLCARIAAPTLVLTGEPGLDHVVSVAGSSEYARLIDGARTAVLEHTGHQGSLTRPAEFAALIRTFVAEVSGGNAGGLQPKSAAGRVA